MGAADASGLVVSYIQSIYWEFGSGCVLPKTGVMMQNRGVSFSLDPTAGHEQRGSRPVLIVCTAAHRDTGVFEAARYGIDRLKEIVPVWKKEVGPNGEEWIEGDYIPKAGE